MPTIYIFVTSDLGPFELHRCLLAEG